MNLHTANGTWPVTFNQARVLAMAERRARHGRPFAVPNRVEVARVRGPVDDDALTEALCRVVHRHSALRSRFQPADHLTPAERELQLLAFDTAGIFDHALYEHRVDEPKPVSVNVTELTSTTPDRQEACIAEIVRQEHTTTLSFDGTPQLRARLARFTESSGVLVLTAPWLAADSVSVDLIWRDLIAEYAAIVEASAAECAAASQFHEFAVWQREHLQTPSFATSLAYWRNEWEYFESAQLRPSDFTYALVETPGASLPSRVHVTRTGTALASSVRRGAEAAGVSPLVLFLSAYFLLLREMTGKERLAVWMGLANRAGLDEHEDTVGWLANHHLIGLDLAACTSSVLEACRSTVVAAQCHERLPLPRLWQQTGRMAEQWWPRVVFDWRVAETYTAGDLSVTTGTTACASPTALAAFVLTVTECASDFQVSVAYAMRYFEQELIQSAVRRFHYFIETLADVAASQT